MSFFLGLLLSERIGRLAPEMRPMKSRSIMAPDRVVEAHRIRALGFPFLTGLTEAKAQKEKDRAISAIRSFLMAGFNVMG